MATFNKGDFTQQGVDGHVRATLRLNEKRYVNLDLTTNENARGVTISGKVIDELNNLEYPIGGVNPTGNIAITENTAEGEPLDVSQYATATVNVSGGILPTMALTINNTSESYVDILDPSVEPLVLTNYGVEPIGADVAPGTETFNVVYQVSMNNHSVPVPYDALVTASDLINCTFDDSPSPTLYITDPSQNASATITLTIIS